MTKALRKTARLAVGGVLLSGAAGGGASWATYSSTDSTPASAFAGIAVAAFIGIGLVAFGEHHYNKNKKPAKR